jgi:tRNA threonylcarbamoyladenosine biosynthesis protein TsaE
MTIKKGKLLETITLNSLEDTRVLAGRIAQKWQQSPQHRWVLGLQGEMGSGKTYFVKALAEAFGFKADEANSPTFAIHQQYENQNLTLHHLDLFRLTTEEELESSGFWDLFYEDQVLIAVEWIDRVGDHQLPENFVYQRMEWEVLDSGQRRVQIFARPQ